MPTLLRRLGCQATTSRILPPRSPLYSPLQFSRSSACTQNFCRTTTALSCLLQTSPHSRQTQSAALRPTPVHSRGTVAVCAHPEQLSGSLLLLQLNCLHEASGLLMIRRGFPPRLIKRGIRGIRQMREVQVGTSQRYPSLPNSPHFDLFAEVLHRLLEQCVLIHVELLLLLAPSSLGSHAACSRLQTRTHCDAARPT